MGLAGPRKRTRIGHDPNNTTWARDNSTFGSKILRAQGWTPGSYLGAKDAAHASHLTAASASHIRVALREDNLGLGARRGADPTENFGLSGFQSLLGRLNGKSDVQLANEKRVESVLRLEHTYQQMGFVRAGYLLGDTFDPKRQESTASPERPAPVEGFEEKTKRPKKKKDRKEDPGVDPPTKTSTKYRKKAELRNSDDERVEASEIPGEERASRHKKTAKTNANESKEDRRRRKLEKRERKEAKRKRKTESIASTEADDADAMAKPADAGNSGSSSSSSSDLPERSGGARHAIRQRFIRQKRMSGMDPKAMREILMIKS